MGILAEFGVFLLTLLAIAATLAILIYIDSLLTKADRWLEEKIRRGRRK